jgi:hypothetical protein
MKKLLSVVALFGSVSTLVCCVLPALFVALGFGATFASLVGSFPQLVWFSEHKALVFGGTALLLIAAFIVDRRRRACATEACETLKGWSHTLLLISVGLYLVGFTFAFLI